MSKLDELSLAISDLEEEYPKLAAEISRLFEPETVDELKYFSKGALALALESGSGDDLVGPLRSIVEILS